MTPYSYLELIKTFKSLLASKRAEIIAIRESYEIGVEKLKFAETQILVLQKEAAGLQARTLSTAKELDDLIKVIEKEAADIDAVKQVIEVNKESSDKATREAQAIKDECEREFEDAMPKMNDAIEALDTLTPQDITSF